MPALGKHTRGPLIAYLTTLVLFFAASFMPEQRLWGLSVWAYWPVTVRLGLFAAGLLVAVAVHRFRGHLAGRAASDGIRVSSSWRFWTVALGVTIALGAMFYLLRARTHFLGDGYLQLTSLASDQPLARSRNYGEVAIHIWVKQLMGLDGERGALISYQGLSIGAGMVFALFAAGTSRLLFRRAVDRALFCAALLSGGYMLLFFGYVENYSLFVLCVGLFTLAGSAAAHERIPRWVIWGPLLLACFLHILGVTLIPAAVYLLGARTRMSRFVSRLDKRLTMSLALIVLMAAGALFYHFYRGSYYFRFAFVPVVANEFTLEGYTMFSAKHALDYLNLMFLLVPGIAVLALGVRAYRSYLPTTVWRWHLILCTSTLGAVFIFDPKLGMPRDWDLFSFVGIPLLVLLAVLHTATEAGSGRARTALVMAIMLGSTGLISRAAVAVVPDLSIRQFEHYAGLDVRKNRSGWFVLQQYYRDRGDSARVWEINTFRQQQFPEEALSYRAEEFLSNGNLTEALKISRRAIHLNPWCFGPWLQWGRALTLMKKYDSAVQVIEIADGLNPSSPMLLYDLGIAYYRVGNLSAAEKSWQRASALDTSRFEPVMALARLYQSRGDRSRYLECLDRVVFRPEAEGIWAKELGDLLLQDQRFEAAARAYQEALDKGADALEIRDSVQRHPELLRQFDLWRPGMQPDPM